MQPPAPQCGDVTMWLLARVGDTLGGMVLAGCWAMQPGFGDLTGERGSARLPLCTRDARIGSPAHTSTGVPTHTHSHVPHTLPHCSAPDTPAPVPGCAKVEDGEENLGESRGTQRKRPTNERATDSIPSNRQWRLLRWLRQPLGKAAGSGGSRGNTARGRAASAVLGTLIKSEPGQRRSN